MKRPLRKVADTIPAATDAFGVLTGTEVKTPVSKWELALYGGACGKHFAEHREYVGDAEWLL